MRWLTWIGIIALSSAFFGVSTVAGCADSGSETSDTSGPGSGGGDEGGGGSSQSAGGAGGTSSGGNGGEGGEFVLGDLTYTGTILDGFTQMPLGGVDVCSLEPPLPCTPTDAMGAFTYVGVHANTRHRVGASLTNYFPIETLIDTGDIDGTLTGFMIAEGIIELGLQSGAGVTWDKSLAAISVTVRNLANQPQAGYSVTLTPDAGEGPFYLTSNSIDPNATSTTTAGTAFFVNIPFGDYDVDVTGPANCTASFIDDDPNQHVAPLERAAQFVIVFDCQ